jgi:hypothetical protein
MLFEGLVWLHFESGGIAGPNYDRNPVRLLVVESRQDALAGSHWHKWSPWVHSKFVDMFWAHNYNF